MEKSVAPSLAGNASTAGHEAYLKHAEDMDVACGIMLASMSLGLQKQHEHWMLQLFCFTLKSLRNRIELKDMRYLKLDSVAE